MAIAVATVALHLPVVLAVLAVAILVGCAGADMFLALRSRPSLRRTDLPVLARGTAIGFSMEVLLESARPDRIRQPVPPELRVEPSERKGSGLDGTIVGRHRGVHMLEPAIVRIAGPLALSTSDHKVGSTETVTVYPDLPRARKLALARKRGRTNDEGRIVNRLGLGTEFESIRDYSPGDDVRQVNWMATARTGRPMTNQYRVDENRDLLCLVDSGRLMASPIADSTRLDIALDAVAVLAVAAGEAGDRVGTLAFAADILRNLPPRRKGAEAVVNALFDIEPVEVESDYELAFKAVSSRKRSLIAIFTDLVDPASARTLLKALPSLSKKHVVMLASCEDRDLKSAITKSPDSQLDFLRAGVSLTMLTARRRNISLLRSLGIEVIETGPLALGPACVRAYSKIKQRARL
jgi:uncharacterized protein (DUF58 family)